MRIAPPIRPVPTGWGAATAAAKRCTTSGSGVPSIASVLLGTVLTTCETEGRDTVVAGAWPVDAAENEPLALAAVKSAGAGAGAVAGPIRSDTAGDEPAAGAAVIDPAREAKSGVPVAAGAVVDGKIDPCEAPAS